MGAQKANESAGAQAHLTVTAVFQEAEGWIVAWVEEIPGVNTQGRTMKEAKENLKDALRLMIESNRARSRENGGEGGRREVLSVAV
jgi:predicted RNase H-like HicB family nuclease